MMLKQKGRRDISYQVISYQNVFYRGVEVPYAWGAGETGTGYGVLFEDDWLIFDELEDAVKFIVGEKRK